MRRLGVAVLLLVICAAGALAAGLTPVTATLKNGLRVVVVETHAAPVVAVRVYVRAGSLYEGDKLGHGMAHYLEHTLSEGTEKRTKEEIDSLTESIGNDSNAYTSQDDCCYHITTASQYWETALDILSDYVFHATLPEEAVKTQKGVILREIAMREDQTEDRIYWLYAQTMFHEHPARYPIIGFADRFVETTRDDLVKYHDEWYVPDNTVVSIAGDVSAEQAIAKCREYLASIPRRPPPPVVLPAEPPQTAPRRRVEVDEKLQRAYVFMGYRTVSLLHPDLYALDVLADILGSGASSRLVRVVREEKQLVDGIACYSHTPAYDAGSFTVTATLDAEKLPEAEEAILAELERCRMELVSPAELERTKTQKAAQLVFARQTAESIAGIVATDLLTTGDPNFSEDYVAKIKAVTREDVRRAAQTYLRPEKLCVAALTPRAPRIAWKGGGGPEKPETAERTLANGLKVLVQRSTASPTVTLCTAAKGGLRFETAATNGITDVMADMLTRGTKTRTREQIAQGVEDMGASLAPYSGRNSFGVQAAALREDLDKILGYTADVLLNATFPEDEFEKERQFTLAAIAQQKDDANTMARKLFVETMFTTHPYRFFTTGTEESIGKLTRAQVMEYYSRYCRPNRTVLAVFGDVEPDQAFAAVEKALGKWQPSPAEDATPPAEPPLTEVRDVRQDREQEQSIIFVGFPGVTVQDQRRYAIDVLDAVMSGRGLPGGRLHDALRGRQLVYYVHAWSEAGLDPGAFVVNAATEPAKTAEVITIIRQIITDLKTTPVGDEELTRGKQMCVAEHDIGLETAASRAQAATLDELYGLGYDDQTKYDAQVQQVTAADVQRVAQELLNLDRCVVAILSPSGATEK
ncbi:MAG: insulinase family protein [Armatimonadetes bacterium]|nr:insulinase family protein [Armatimonadota bacterium]